MPDFATSAPGERTGLTQPLEFRPLARADFPLLHRWLAAPHVRAWWRGPAPTLQAIEQKYGPRVDGNASTRCFIIHSAGIPVGMIQGYRHADHLDGDRTIGTPAAAGMDYLIGEADHCGRGVGSEVVTAFTTVLFSLYPDVAVIVAVPQADNRASRRVLEKAGFTLADERELDSGDPSDSGPSAVYSLPRPARRG